MKDLVDIASIEESFRQASESNLATAEEINILEVRIEMRFNFQNRADILTDESYIERLYGKYENYKEVVECIGRLRREYMSKFDNLVYEAEK